VRELCTTLLNAYLIQLLETGHLHADPHPGNLIRTLDGKICILDFGLMTEVSALPGRGIRHANAGSRMHSNLHMRLSDAAVVSDAQAKRLTSRRYFKCSHLVHVVGLCVQVTPQQSLALVEYIAHLSVQDWTAVTGDLQRLGRHPSWHPAPETNFLAVLLSQTFASLEMWLSPIESFVNAGECFCGRR